MTKSISIIIDPIVSLKGIEHLVDSEVLKYGDCIEEALTRYEHLAGCIREVVVSGMNSHLKARTGLSQIPFETVFREYGDKRDLLAEVPYLLGLAMHPDFLRQLQQVQSIEVFENKPEGLFKGIFGRSSQLCLRRVGIGYIIAISSYVHKAVINAGAAMSPNCIGVLSFPDKVVDKTYLSEKMIC